MTFENSHIQYVDPTDFESIATLQPDLILGLPFDAKNFEQLFRIAPTYLIPELPDLERHRRVSDLVGRAAVHSAPRARFDQQIAQARLWLGDHEFAYSKIITGFDGALSTYARYGALIEV